MKKQLLLCTAFLLTLITNAQTGANDLTERHLRGKVKSIVEVEYEVVEKFGEPEKGKKKKIDAREYNTAGNETQQQVEDFTLAGQKTLKSFKYQDKTKVVEIREETGDKVKITKIEYNPQGKMGTVDFTDGKGNLENRQKYKYDGDGSLIQTDTYNSDGSLKFKLTRGYNAKKQLVKKEWFNTAGKSTYLETYQYDNNGNRVEEASLNTEVKTADTTFRRYRYNAKKQKIEENFSRSGSRDKLFTDDFGESFEYNEQGDLVRKSYLFQEETTVYSYDQHNNWIKAVKTSGSTLGELMGKPTPELFGKPTQEIIERQIKYY